MNAIIQSRYGPPRDVLRYATIDRPIPRDGDVIVEACGAAIAGDDWHLLEGWPYAARPAIGLRRPRSTVPGFEVAGRVVECGPDATRFAVGDPVFGWCRGGWAEFVRVPEAQLAAAPANVPLADLGVVPVSAFTALQALRDGGRVAPEHRVLINGASGGVGTFAVQIAHHLGAHVTAVCSAPHHDLVRDLGADAAVDYRTTDVFRPEAPYDVIIDLIGDRPRRDARRALAPDGALVMVGAAGGRWFKGTHRWLVALALNPFTRQRLHPLVHQDRADDLETIRDWLAEGTLRPVITARFPLRDVVAALDHAAAGHGTGKIALDIPG